MVRLEKMNEFDFDNYINNSIKDYAAEKIKAGAWAQEEAENLSKETFARLLPKGIYSENQYLFSIIDDDKQIKVGYLWFQCYEKLIEKEAFVYDFIVFKEFRSKGYGTQALKSLDDVVKGLGINKISLHVFAHNKRALSLYEKTGFIATDINMSKNI
ncbi:MULTISPECIES: GNAT family N-acetyltransferase [unclassified Clostridium]|uniref:GNAT family N-acetyltransferase n=1 Tax=unclassified Clostridium TaxID=2614128 RepID=UPI0025C2717B|nr:MULTISPECIES: GNAT family N-acetyltransferase [unclassified Clostridium]